MAFAEDLDIFFDLDGFAVAAVITITAAHDATPAVTRTINVIFNDPTQAVEMYGSQVEASAGFLQCKAADLAGLKRGQAVAVNDATYKIEKITRDGTGLANIFINQV